MSSGISQFHALLIEASAIYLKGVRNSWLIDAKKLLLIYKYCQHIMHPGDAARTFVALNASSRLRRAVSKALFWAIHETVISAI